MAKHKPVPKRAPKPIFTLKRPEAFRMTRGIHWPPRLPIAPLR
jgi:hypothetical protein